MLTLICLISALVTIFYVSYRLKAKLGSRKIFWLYAVFFLLATVGYVALIMTGTYTSDNRYVSVLYVVLGLLFAFHLYFFFLTVVAQVFERYLPGKRGKVATVVSVFLAWAIVAAGLYFSHTPRVTEHVVKVKGLAAPVTIMNAPDMHLGPARGAGFLKKVLAEIEKRNPDIVVYNGDLIDGNIALKEEIFSLFAGVKSPQYLTTGNHEFYVDTARELEFAKAAGMKIIRNVNVETNGINLIGLEYMNADLSTDDAHRVNDLTIAEELPKIKTNPALPRVLIHHSPVGMEYAIKEKIPVMLTGHTHGGQFFPGQFLINARFPNYKGRYDFNGLTLLVSRGLGTFGPPIRIGTFSEMQFVTLTPDTGT